MQGTFIELVAGWPCSAVILLGALPSMHASSARCATAVQDMAPAVHAYGRCFKPFLPYLSHKGRVPSVRYLPGAGSRR